MVKRILALSLLMVCLSACGGQQDDVADLSVWSTLEGITVDQVAHYCDSLNTVEEQHECSVTPEKYFRPCPFPLMGMCPRYVEEPCVKENHHLDALVSKLKKVHEAITLTPDSSVTFDFSVSDSAIVKVEHSSISWKFTALKAGTTSITLVRTTPGIQTCSYTQAINISE